MNSAIRDAFEAAIIDRKGEGVSAKPKSDKSIRAEALALMKQVELVIENLPDQSITAIELYEEIAGQAWRG